MTSFPDTALLLSIRPEYATKIFNGTKTVELRRTRPRLQKGDRVFVYVSSPVKSLVGCFEAAGVFKGTPDELWEESGENAAITRDDFDAYFREKTVGYAIAIQNASELPKRVSLAELRQELGSFHPPQCYHYLAAKAVVQIVSLATPTPRLAAAHCA